MSNIVVESYTQHLDIVRSEVELIIQGATSNIVLSVPNTAVSIVHAGPVGPPGPRGLSGIHSGPTPPEDTSLLWYDTN